MTQRRFDRQPALGRLAETICIYDKTDGFCSPRSKEVCMCWDNAEKMLQGSGLSARACCWVLMNSKRIEEEAEKCEKR